MLKETIFFKSFAYWIPLFLFLVILTSLDGYADWTIPASVEEVTRESDLIVLGKVIETDPEGIHVGERRTFCTRHTFLVEKYFLGEGPKKISLLTLGGVEMKKVGDEVHPIYTQALGSEQVKKGEELVAFFREGPGGYYFVEWDGAKYLVEMDPEAEERTITIRLRKKQYMRGRALEAFKKLEERETGPNPIASVQAKLRGPKYFTEIVSVEDLAERMEEIIQGETATGQ